VSASYPALTMFSVVDAKAVSDGFNPGHVEVGGIDDNRDSLVPGVVDSESEDSLAWFDFHFACSFEC
jgi:hypothetical protein